MVSFNQRNHLIYQPFRKATLISSIANLGKKVKKNKIQLNKN